MKLFFPDCLWSPHQISGSIFLYFHQETIVLTLHPSASAALLGINPFTFISLVENRAPPWKDSFAQFVTKWRTFRTSLKNTQELIEPLRSDGLTTRMFSYARDTNAFNRADELIRSSTLDPARITSFIDDYHASDELFSHLFFEKVVETKYGDISSESLVNVGKELAERALADDCVPMQSFDWSPIYEYCSHLFSTRNLQELLARAYMFRMPIVNHLPAVLLSNSKLITFLSSLPIKLTPDRADLKLDADVVAWEFFRQLLSPIVDPLDKGKIVLLKKMRSKRSEEIERLKNKCYELSEELLNERNLEELRPRVAQIIRARVANDLQELLKVDRRALSELLTEIFADEKTWLAVSSFVLGLASGREVLTAGAAIYSLSRIGAKSAKAAAGRRQALSTNAYTLIYRMTQS
jgi:hypothetical protein